MIMKLRHTLAMASSLFLVAGCAHHERQASYDQNISPYPTYSSSSSSGDTTANSDSTQSATGAYATSPATTSSGGYSATQGAAGVSPEDSALASQVRQSLLQDTTLASIIPGLNISVRNGVVTLSGTVISEEQKRSIESIAQQTSGVTTVNNRLEVSQAMLQQNDTAQDSSRARAANEQGSGGSLTPTSRANESANVYSGSTGSGSEMQNAGTSSGLSQTSRTNENSSVYSMGSTNQSENANANQELTPTSRTGGQDQMYSNTNGMESATNQSLSATSDRPGQSTSTLETNQLSGATGAIEANVQGATDADRTLGRQISQELRADTSLASVSSQIQISVNDGKVTLKGNVRNAQQKQDIESAVQRLSGVSSVDNQLEVSADESAPRLNQLNQ